MTGHVAYLGDSGAILGAVGEMIRAAERAIVLQMYLFAGNTELSLIAPRDGAFPYADTVANWLIDKKRQAPAIPIVVVLDTNTPADPQRTRGKRQMVRHRLRAAGIIVLNANLFATRFDRRRRLVPSMNLHLDHADVEQSEWVARQQRWQVLHNVEDHRKNLVIDGGALAALTSHNFIDAAWDWHENMFLVRGPEARRLWCSALAAIRLALDLPQDLTDAERRALAALSADEARTCPTIDPKPPHAWPQAVEAVALNWSGDARVLEHEEIRPRLHQLIDGAGAGDEIIVATAYFSDLALFARLERALDRGASVRVLIDSIDGLPIPPLVSWLTTALVNHKVCVRAGELARRSSRFELRVHRSIRDNRPGPMMHLKTVARLGAHPLLIGGQANLTPNSLDGSWLETDVETDGSGVIEAFRAHFESLWKEPECVPAPTPSAPRRWAYDRLLDLFARLGIEP